jgi:hypothetical protein
MKAIIFLFVILLFMSVSMKLAAQESEAPGGIEIPCVHPHEITQTEPLILHFEWKPADLTGVVGYNLQVAEDPDFEYLVINIITSETKYDAGFSASGTYYVRMRIAIVLEEFPGPFCNVMEVYVWG